MLFIIYDCYPRLLSKQGLNEKRTMFLLLFSYVYGNCCIMKSKSTKHSRTSPFCGDCFCVPDSGYRKDVLTAEGKRLTEKHVDIVSKVLNIQFGGKKKILEE